MEEKEINELKTDIAILRVNMANIERYFGSIEKNISKVERVSDQIIVTVSRLDKIEEALQVSKSDGDMRRRESENSVREIKNQMSAMNSSTQEAFTSSIKMVIEEVKILKDTTTASFDRVYTTMEKNRDETDSDLHKLEERISSLEQWKWWSMGVGITIFSVGSLVFQTVFG